MFSEKNKQRYLLILAFVCGMAIMAVEISASRLLAPYFGTSTFVWTNVIGVIMVALAIGYYLGGKLADKNPELKVLLRIILLSCILLAIIPFVTRPLVEFVTGNISIWQSATSMIFMGSLLTVTILFIFPIILLGMVSPFIIKLLSLNNSHIGKDAGSVFAISTVGSIVGTFLPVLVFVPYLGTRKTILFFAIFLFCTALFGLLNKQWLSSLSLILFLLLIPQLPAIKAAPGAIAEGESVYQYYQVADNGDMRYLKINEGLGIFSVLNKNPDSVLTDSYFDYYNLLPYLDGNAKDQNFLILGLAGGTVSTQLNHFFGSTYNLHIDGVEIDKQLIEMAKKYFNLENPSLTIYNLDGRNFLDAYDRKYDAVVIDVYANQLYISFHMTTSEFFDLVKKHLNPNGVVAMNVNATGTASPLLKNITNTMLLHFKNVYTIWNGNWNYLVLASDRQFDFDGLKNVQTDPQLKPVVDNALANLEKVDYDNSFGFLTDDKAPIEQLTDRMILDYVFNKI